MPSAITLDGPAPKLKLLAEPMLLCEAGLRCRNKQSNDQKSATKPVFALLQTNDHYIFALAAFKKKLYINFNTCQ